MLAMKACLVSMMSARLPLVLAALRMPSSSCRGAEGRGLDLAEWAECGGRSRVQEVQAARGRGAGGQAVLKCSRPTLPTHDDGLVVVGGDEQGLAAVGLQRLGQLRGHQQVAAAALAAGARDAAVRQRDAAHRRHLHPHAAREDSGSMSAKRAVGS